MIIGHIEAIFRYPVKSMASESLDDVQLGWHGLEGDRRLAFRKMEDRGGFPWLSAGKVPDLLRYAPCRAACQALSAGKGDLPTHVRTPEGKELPIFGEDLATEIGRRYGAPVQMMQLNHGIFDEAALSVIATDTVSEVGRLVGRSLDSRQFRPNIVVRLLERGAFQEDQWVGNTLAFGEEEDAATVAVTMRDLRCAMVSLDPNTAVSSPEVLKVIASANQTFAGIYAAVTRSGRLSVGQALVLRRASETG